MLRRMCMVFDGTAGLDAVLNGQPGFIRHNQAAGCHALYGGGRRAL